MSDKLINGRYQLQEKLGEGGMATVYRAFDLHLEREVAIKIMKTSLTGTSKKRFSREFRAVTAVNHPSCIKVYEFGETDDFPFFTMEVFCGSPVTTLIGQNCSLIFSALLQAAEAIDDVHLHKIIHRDVKPTNLLVDVSVTEASQPRVQLRLTDFGLSRFAGSPSSLSVDSGFVGTLAYAAPEQISNGLIDHRADLYALAIVGFELLTGKHPFEVSRRLGIQALMRSQLTEHPSGLRGLNSEIPSELENVILAYLNKNPFQRPSSAAILRHVLSGLLGLPSAQDPVLDSTEIRWPSQRLIARSQELGKVVETLNESLSPIHISQAQWSQSPIPSVVFITGEAGFGKSNLMREVADVARQQGTIVLEGRCFEGNLAPFQPFVEIIRQMLIGIEASDSDSGKGQLPPLAELMGLSRPSHDQGSVEGTVVFATRTASDALRDVIQKYSPELLRIAPDLRQWLPGEAFRQGDLSRETNYVLRAIATFFVEVSQIRGVCLLVEDLHWADQSTLDLMRHLASSVFRRREQCLDSNLTYPRLFCCCTMRSGKSLSEGLPRELHRERYARIIELQPLTLDGSRALISLRLECDPTNVSPNLIEQLHVKCHGNPYFIVESVRAWRGAGRIMRTDAVWQLDDSVDEGSAWPESVRDVLRTRLDSISATARQVLAASSVIGAIVDPDLLREVLNDISETDFLDAVDELLNRQVLLETGNAASRLEFAHDLLRELSYDELTENRRRAIHRRVGETLEELHRSGREVPPDAIAGHFAAAQIAEKAYHYLLESGEAALRLYAADDAILHLERALRFGESVKNTTERQRLFELLALAHGAAGRPREAIAYLERNRKFLTEPIPLARLEERIGALYFRIADFKALDHFDSGMKALNIHRPRNLTWVVIFGVWGLVQYFLTAWLPLPRKLSGEKRDRAVIAHDIAMNLTYLWPRHSIVRCLHATGRQFATARATGDPVYLFQGFARQALLFGILSFHSFAKRAVKSALKLADSTNDVELQAIAKGHVGCVHYFAGRLREAEECLLEAVSVLERRGDSWFRLFFSHNLRHVYSMRADNGMEVTFARLEMQIGETVHDTDAASWGAYGMAEAMARVGRLEEAHKYIQRALGMVELSSHIVVRPTALQIYGFVLLQSGEYQQARQVLDDARRMIETNIAYMDYSVRTYPQLVEAVLGCQWHVTHAVSKADVAYGWRMSRRARFWGWRFPNYWPHAMRVSGRAAFAKGKLAKAQRYFRKAIDAAEKLGSPFDKARAMVDLAKVSPSERDALERDARVILSEIGATLPPGEFVAPGVAIESD